MLQLTLVGLLVAGAAVKLVEMTVRRHERGSAALLAGCLALLAIGQLLSIPEVTSVLTGLAGAMGKVTYNAATILGLYMLLVFFLRAVQNDRVRRVWRESLVMAATIIALIALMAVTPSGLRTHSLSSPFLSYPTVAAFYLVGGVYFVYSYLAVARLIWVFVREERGALVWALRSIALGLVGLTITAVVRIARVLEVSLGGGLSLTVLNAVNLRISLVAYLFVSLGLLLAGWWQGIRVWRERQRQRRQFVALEPLWSFVSSIYPEVVLSDLSGNSRPAWFGPTTWNRQLYRRVLECRDGLLRLGPAIAALVGSTDLSRETPESLAAYMREAAREPRGFGSADPRVAPVMLAIPPVSTGIGGDVDALIAISTALNEGAES